MAPDLPALAEAMSKGEKERDGRSLVEKLLVSAKQREMGALRESTAVVGVAGSGGDRARSASSSRSFSGIGSLKDASGPWKVTCARIP